MGTRKVPGHRMVPGHTSAPKGGSGTYRHRKGAWAIMGTGRVPGHK